MRLSKSELQLETIVSRIHQEELDLQPDFQRGEVWDKKRRQRLVDTILRDWYIPAVHVVSENNGDEVVLDGQQRLSAITDFIDNKFAVDGTIEPFDEKISSLDKLIYSDLPPELQKSIKRYTIQVITLSDHIPGEPNELFFRLNQAYNLTPPEKRNALHGGARDQVKQIVEELTDRGLLNTSTIGFSNGRLAYDDIVARTCVAIEIGTLSKHINNKVVEDFYRSETFSNATLEGVLGAGEGLLEQISFLSSKVRFNKGTLQTWLTYCYWAPIAVGPIPPYLLRDFEETRAAIKKGEEPALSSTSSLEREIVAIYDDRASYRVTDVSSVQLRDIAIHLFSQIHFDSPPLSSSEDLVLRLEGETASIRSQLTEFVKGSWGDLNALTEGLS